MPPSSDNSRLSRQRRAMYTFGDYNPYQPSEKEWLLVEENLERFKSGQIKLRGFLRQTPHFARWREEHLRQARVLLVTNEPGLSGIAKLYRGLVREKDPESVAEYSHKAMLSWLSLSNHSSLKLINGESPWGENGAWQTEHPRMAACGKVGYFLLPGEETKLAGCKILHLELSPFPQNDPGDVNPRNDQDLEYHRENLKTIQRFCDFARPEEDTRYIFIMGNRARIRSLNDSAFQLEGIRTTRKDKSHKILDILRVSQTSSDSVRVRICRQWPRHGRDVKVLEMTRASAFALQPMPIEGADS